MLVGLILLTTNGVMAQEPVPDMMRIVNVVQGDVLNMSSGPGAEYDIVGAFAPQTDGIEVTAYNPDGTWARVNTQEWSGWLSTAFLAPSDLPTYLSCFGTEPFWSVDLSGPDAAIWSTPEGVFTPHQSETLTSNVDVDLRETLIALYEDRAITVTSFAEPNCSDGMSDRLYALGVSAIIRYDEGWGEVWRGCCTMVAD
mgnify:CR=1 FL=1